MITFRSIRQTTILPINPIFTSFLKLAQNLTNEYQENEAQTNGTETVIFEGNHSDKEYVCYESLEEYGPIILNIHYWMNGIGTIVIGSIGIIGNIITILVLQRIDTNVMFNRLLLTLGKILFLLTIKQMDIRYIKNCSQSYKCKKVKYLL